MIDRQLIGDVALAVLIALPTVAVARPQPFVHQDHAAAAAPLVKTAAVAQRAPVAPRLSLLG